MKEGHCYHQQIKYTVHKIYGHKSKQTMRRLMTGVAQRKTVRHKGVVAARRNARIASKLCTSLATAIPSVRLSVRLSHAGITITITTRRYCVKTTERRMTQSSLKDSKMCLVFRQPKRSQRDDRFP